MILRKSKDLSFCQHIIKEDESMSSGMIRRLSIETFSNDLLGSNESLHIRSLLVFTEEVFTNNFFEIIPTKYRLLKVLYFKDNLPYFVSVPENFGNLAHLKYLTLRGSNMPSKLPKFICKLHNLETLDVRNTHVEEIPKEICNLRKLRHLLGDYITLFQLKNCLGGMASLQTLRDVKLIMIGSMELIRELGKLKQLRNLSLIFVREEQGSTVCSSLNEMTYLEKLHIESYADEAIDLSIILSLPMLQKLRLHGKLMKFPEWVPQLQSLVKLSLLFSRLTNDPLKSLQNLPHLLFLEMLNAYAGESLYFENGGFRQLKELSLACFPNLKSIIIDKGALNSLEKLNFRSIMKIKTVPPGIQHLEKLQVLELEHMSHEFNECITPNGGPENPIIQHVPLVKVTVQDYLEGITTHVIHHPRH